MLNFVKRVLSIIIVSSLALAPIQSLGFMKIGVDVFYNGFGYVGHSDVFVRTHSYLFFGGESFSAGPVLFYQKNNKKSEEVGIGGGLRLGHPFFIEIDYTDMRITHYDTVLLGNQYALILGWEVSNSFQVTLPLFYSVVREKSGHEISRASIAPHVGIGWRF